MSAIGPDETMTSKWQEVEDFLTSLYELARAPLAPHDFYDKLLKGCIKMLAAEGGAAWQSFPPGKWQPLVQFNLPVTSSEQMAAHSRIVQHAREAHVTSPGGANPSEHCLLVAAVSGGDSPRPQMVIELLMRAGASHAVCEGWKEFLAAVIHAAEEYELRRELRVLRGEQSAHADVLSLLRRIHQGSTLNEVALEVVNEGRRFLGVDRLSLLLGRGGRWDLIGASGVDRLEQRADAVKDLESLAEATAHWGEPIDYADDVTTSELPTPVLGLLQRHIDESHARRLVAVPMELGPAPEAKSSRVTAVFIAENFGKAQLISHQDVMELAQLCEPAIGQVLTWDRWPIRPVVNWTNWANGLWHAWGLTRLAILPMAAALLLLSLLFVHTDYEVEAPATLMPLVVRDVFAPTNGKVLEIKVAHGDWVKKGDVLALLEDSQLALEMERVHGEQETVRQRLEAINVVRTDRQTREEPASDRLPLSAEARQLELRQASLLEQAMILEKCRDDLTLRSPIDGTVLTLDAQNLLRARPVERGQILFTVADTTSGWQLEARVPQDRIGHVVSASASSDDPIAVRFRLASDLESIHTGHVLRIAETAVLDPTQLEKELPDVRVDVVVDETTLPAARPEMKAVVRLNCGRRPIGYVWLHDVWDSFYSWLAF